MKTLNKWAWLLLPSLIACFAFSCQAQQPVPVHGVKITWQASTDTDIDQYQVSRGTVAGGPYPAIACTTNGALQCIDTFPVGNVTGKFFYVAQAHSPTNGWSPISNEATPIGTVPKTTAAPGVAATAIQ